MARTTLKEVLNQIGEDIYQRDGATVTEPKSGRQYEVSRREMIALGTGVFAAYILLAEPPKPVEDMTTDDIGKHVEDIVTVYAMMLDDEGLLEGGDGDAEEA